jgi:hypothetical protein
VLLDQEKDIEWSIRELIYRNYEINTTIKNTDIPLLLQKNYQEYKNNSLEQLTQLANAILPRLADNRILTPEGENDAEITYKISSKVDRYQCNECNQISYIGEQEERKCFSCESINLRERNVR